MSPLSTLLPTKKVSLIAQALLNNNAREKGRERENFQVDKIYIEILNMIHIELCYMDQLFHSLFQPQSKE